MDHIKPAPTRERIGADKVSCYVQAFNSPTAPPISASGKSRMTPPANSKQTISTGTAIANKSEARIFAAPQVSDRASPMALKASQQNRMITNNSNISFTPFRSRRLDFLHRYMDPELFKVLGVLSLFLYESDSKDSLARRHLKNTFISHAPPFEVALILIELHLRINDKFCKIGHGIFARSAKYGSAWDIPCAATRIHFNFLAL